jgi:hypothetical protein
MVGSVVQTLLYPMVDIHRRHRPMMMSLKRAKRNSLPTKLSLTMTRDGWSWDAVMSAEVVTITFAALSQILSLFSSNFLLATAIFCMSPVEGTSSFYTRVQKMDFNFISK